MESSFYFEPGEDRAVALQRCHDFIFGLFPLEQFPRSNGLVMLIGEAAKNVIDHAGGVGYVNVIPGLDATTIQVRDFGPGFDFAACQRDGFTTKPSGGPNCGIGLGAILDMAPGLGVTIEHGPMRRGYRYRFRLPKERFFLCSA